LDIIKVLLVDDSNIVQIMLEKVIQAEPDIEIVGQAYNGIEGVTLAKKLSPDVVVMDINMPLMDGLEAIQEIMNEKPVPIIVFSSASRDIVNLSFKSIELGAVDIIEKPFSTDLDSLKQMMEQKLIRTIRIFADFKVIRRIKKKRISSLRIEISKLEEVSEKLKEKHQEYKRQYRDPGDKTEVSIQEKPDLTSDFPVIGIATSTGGPQTIRAFIEDQNFKNINASFIVVQHMAQGFILGYSEWIRQYSPIPVTLASEGQNPEPYHLYIAPGDYHLGFTPDGRFDLIDSPPILGIKPSANIMFKSLAQVFKERSIAIILTGMGNDGADGIVEIKKNGGYIIAQDEKSSIIFGMPKAAISTGGVDSILHLSQIPEFLIHYCLEREKNDE